MPPASRLTDMHTCPMVTPGTPPIPHVGGPISGPCSPNVIVGGLPAARVTDMAVCVGPPDVIVKGSPTVHINGLLAARMGDMTAHGGVIVIGCPTVIIGEVGTPSGLSFGPGPITMAAATELFNEMSRQPDIAFRFPADGCYARAHLMVQRMELQGATPGKVWSFSSDPMDPLWVKTENDPRGKVDWGYHVAPTIPVMASDGSVQDLVIDPSLFDRPVTIDEWKETQHDHPDIKITKIGEAPIARRGGTGYWPGPDPTDGPDENAEETMLRYKRCEGKDPKDCD
jgi:uncharacterized Zn-binding protein involved in type VI secretion